MRKIKLFFIWVWHWLLGAWYSINIRIAIALSNVEDEVMSGVHLKLDGKNRQEQRKRHRNQTLERMYQGQRDERYIQHYYELLWKAEKFMRNATPSEMQIAADKWGMSYGKSDDEMRNVGSLPGSMRTKKPKKDKWGKRYEHYGFFDPKNPNFGKTLAEVMREEVKQRATKDDDYPLQYMVSNKPLEEGLSKTKEIKENKDSDSMTQFEGLNHYQKAKIRKFPIKIRRENDNTPNKIEQLTDFLHIKYINSRDRVLEFFVNNKFGLNLLKTDNTIFKEVINIKQVWFRDEYGNLHGFIIDKFYKRSNDVSKNTDKDTYEVIKFYGKEIITLDDGSTNNPYLKK